ncbi:PWWP domain-containing protein [Xylariales sp. AK1849]|nr:PWWP domain-containing protein [Xylariales sp. AK1849]
MSDGASAPIEQKVTESEASVPASDPAPASAADEKTEDAQPSTTATSEDQAPKTKEPAAPTDEKAAGDADVEVKDSTDTAEEKAPEPAAEDEAIKSEAQPDTKAPAEEKLAETAPDATVPEAEDAPVDANVIATPANNKARRKSAVSTGKKLNKKASKAKLQLNVQPGEHYFARLKGYPPWPVVVCDEEMLPQSMLSTRPVSTRRADGTYREDFADGGKRAQDRTYPVMFLQTNEFSWAKNTELSDLDPITVSELVTTKMRKDLQQAHLLAAEENSLDYYKQVLLDFEEQKLADAEAKAARVRAKKEKSTKKVDTQPDEDIEMADAEDVQEEGQESDAKASKKRKAEDDASTPQRSDSVKKPKIKLTSSATPKAAANGEKSPKPAKESTAKSAKSKSKAAKAAKEADAEKPKKEVIVPKEPELTPEERHVRKEKEILFLRHRLQKGLLNRDSEPKEDEMKNMSDFLTKLEGFPDLEASIIRATKINKVLKAILKLAEIPKEAELQFKPRSQTLLDKWTKILASETTTPAGTSAPTNGVNGTSGSATASKEPTNGVNGEAAASKGAVKEEKAEPKGDVKEAPKAETESKTTPASVEKPAEEVGL